MMEGVGEDSVRGGGAGEEQVGGGLVSRGKRVVLQFMRRYPAKLAHPKRTRLFCERDGGPMENQVNDATLGAVGVVGDNVAHIRSDTGPLPQLPSQRGLIGVAGFDFAARELPQTSQDVCRTSLGDEVSSLLLDDGNRHTNVRYDIAHGRAPRAAFSERRSQPVLSVLRHRLGLQSIGFCLPDHLTELDSAPDGLFPENRLA